MDPAKVRNLLRMCITRGYESFLKNNRERIVAEVSRQPDADSKNRILTEYHRQTLALYERNLSYLAVLGAIKGQTGTELRSFMEDLESQLYAIDKIYRVA